jgi:uncharacterized zinc-type alcohol dehydrogenase-like protein
VPRTLYFATADESAFETLRGRFDLILNTVSSPIPTDAYLSMLRVGE